MYQSIDDDSETGEVAAAPLARWPVLVAILCGALAFAAVYALSPGPSEPRPVAQASAPEARAAYLKALGEPDAALRRARLRDWLNQNPEHARAEAAQSQLYVLDAAEAQAWQDTVSAAYRPGTAKEERRAAVEGFQRGWGRYLGGREAEVADLLAEIEGLPDALPRTNRDLPAGASPFPDTVPSDTLAGGPILSRPGVRFFPPASAPEPAVREPVQAATVTPPRVRRNVTPRYPGKAQRRGVSGVVTLALNIDARGRVAMTEVVSVEAERYADDFVRAAERAAMRTRFHPKTVNGEPTESVGVRKRYRFESSRR